MPRAEQSKLTAKSKECGKTWADNWKLLRRLWPSWKPNDDIIREVWFKNYDNDATDQDLLNDAIVHHKSFDGMFEPKFIELNDSYRNRLNQAKSEIRRYRVDPEETPQANERRHRERIAKIQLWTPERFEAARRRLGEFRPSLRSKSTDPETWTQGYTGLLIAADQLERSQSE